MKIVHKENDLEGAVKYVPVKSNHFHKLRIGWNIGIGDYRFLLVAINLRFFILS